MTSAALLRRSNGWDGAAVRVVDALDGTSEGDAVTQNDAFHTLIPLSARAVRDSGRKCVTVRHCVTLNHGLAAPCWRAPRAHSVAGRERAIDRMVRF